MTFNLKKLYQEKNIKIVFKIMLILKGIFSVIQLLAGSALFFVSQAFIINFVSWLTQEELFEDPKDFLANYFIQAAQVLSISSQHFAALYLLLHGVVKLFLIIMLLKRKLFAYPLSILVFIFFMVYQLNRYFYTHSVGLLLLTLLDVLLIWLTWHEYNYMKRKTI